MKSFFFLMKCLNEAILKLSNCNQSLNIFFESVRNILCSALKTPSEVWEFFSDKIQLWEEKTD